MYLPNSFLFAFLLVIIERIFQFNSRKSLNLLALTWTESSVLYILPPQLHIPSDGLRKQKKWWYYCLLKKPSLNKMILKNFHQFIREGSWESGWFTIPKLLEEIAYLNPFQSGFRQKYITESTLVTFLNAVCKDQNRGGTHIALWSQQFLISPITVCFWTAFEFRIGRHDVVMALLLLPDFIPVNVGRRGEI